MLLFGVFIYLSVHRGVTIGGAAGAVAPGLVVRRDL